MGLRRENTVENQISNKTKALLVWINMKFARKNNKKKGKQGEKGNVICDGHLGIPLFQRRNERYGYNQQNAVVEMLLKISEKHSGNKEWKVFFDRGFVGAKIENMHQIKSTGFDFGTVCDKTKNCYFRSKSDLGGRSCHPTSCEESLSPNGASHGYVL